jgi:hypothetical protein
LATKKLLQRKVLLIILVSKKFPARSEIAREDVFLNGFTVVSDTDRSPPSDCERHVFDKRTRKKPLARRTLPGGGAASGGS